MKLLGISLMRLGDLLQLAPLLKTYKENGAHHLTMLIYKEFAIAKQVMPFVDEWVYIDRKDFQNRAKDRYIPILDSVYEMDKILTELESKSFERVLCLSHNKVSHSLCKLLADHVPDQLGSFSGKGPRSDLAWVRYMNEVASYEGLSSFHLMDVYRKILNLDELHVLMEPHELNYNLSVQIPDEKYICLQITSNEPKKTLSIEDWAFSIEHFRLLDTKTKILVLLAPSEKATGELLENEFRIRCVKNVEIVYCDLRNAMALIHSAGLFVTPDTSIKYLAYGATTKVIELSLGSSQFRQTGPYQNESLILQSTIPCAPCSHSLNCPHASFLCHEKMAGSFLGFILFHFMESNYSSVDLIADEFSDVVQIFRPQIRSNSYWFAQSAGVDSLDKNLEPLLAQSAWSLVLSQRLEEEDWSLFEKEAISIRQMLVSNYDFSTNNMRKLVEKVEASLIGTELELSNVKARMQKNTESQIDQKDILSEVSKCLNRMSQAIGSAKIYNKQFQDVFSDKADDNKVEHTNHILENMKHFLNIERKLTEIIRSDFKE